MKLETFPDSSGTPVYVNAELVTYVRQYSAELTVIYFDHNHSVSVRGVAGTVASTLASAEKL